ncbi:MAG TPA: hypothetical protein V6D28_22065 [Leptolyngbyaceae cyanobacterium]
MVTLQVCLSSNSLSEIFAQASRSGTISRADHSKLTAALMDNYLSEEEINSVKRLLYAVRRNRVKVEGVSHFFLSLVDLAS